MALLSLIFDRSQKLKILAPNEGPDGRISAREFLIIDSATNISHQLNSDLTDNPVEEGIDVSDHVDIRPITLSFDGVISEAPISIEQAIIGNVSGAAGGFIGQAGGGIAGVAATVGIARLGGLLMNDEGKKRVTDAYLAMLELRDLRIPVTIVTELQQYKSMILTSFNPVQNAQNGNSLVFTATFREIRIVQTQEVTLAQKAVAPNAAASAVNSVNQGNKNSPTSTAANTERAQSLLSGLTGLGG